MRLLIKAIMKLYLFFPLIVTVLFFKAIVVNGAPESKEIKLKVNELAEINKIGTKVDFSQLPSPYNELLTQPLMTKSIEKYYERSAIIKTIFAAQDPGKNTYQRAIVMFIDSNKERNQPDLAQTKKEVTVVELAFITMNFNELPKNMIEEILHTNTPFGKLLAKYQLQILSHDRTYYKIRCNSALASLIHCNLNDFIYGRTNTIIRADNKKWLAHVVEILPNSTKEGR
ncbi:hypothetical protein OQJ19_01200 [Fluoribacter gormanii]|uniref:Uncharacterized protein n=1 Tax=Fluoribacter gormanii TaxID=464 RepID=A0A377GIF2_9GAMM|nr:hypothetical protein [Fluoribacter gormanii]KTD03317.1 hypothetical protein Lgor_1302 [Fluoribacter gormanii]MCW8469277.1 hypothetical protein [Fluoribacter gormanii]SIQ54059.1 hypothetical protein SAMN05421777_101264 [Fluoribacter gormanii]STO24343.1 Uncharacterised protein [Fluoribacter gormanii]